MSTSKPTRAAIYTRVSSEEQAQEGTSLEVQRDRATAYCKAQGWDLAEVFTDAGISGAKADRPALQALLAAVESGQVDVVVVCKMDRLARSMRHLSPMLGDLDDKGVALVSIAESFDSQSPAGRLMRNMLGSMAEWERDVIRERTESGRLARVRAGGWSGGEPPFGFQVEGKGKDAHLVLNHQEAHVIRYAVSLLLDRGMGPLAVVNALNAEGMLPRKAARWSLTLLRTTLVRGPWGGVWTYAKPSARTKAEPIQVAIPEMLPADRHAALLAYLKNSTTPRGNAPTHPLSGLLVGPCGHPFHGVSRRDRGNRRYRCRHAKDVGKGWTCDAPTVLADDMDDRAWEHVLAMLADPDSLRAAADDHLGILASAAGVEADALERAKAEVSRIDTALRNAFAAGLKAGLPADVIEGTVADLNADLANARNRVSTITAMAADTKAQAAQVEAIQAVADLARTTLEDADAETRAKVFRLLNVRVTLQHVTQVGETLTEALDALHPEGQFRDLEPVGKSTKTAPGGEPVLWSIQGEIAHGTLLAHLAPRQAGVLSPEGWVPTPVIRFNLAGENRSLTSAKVVA